MGEGSEWLDFPQGEDALEYSLGGAKIIWEGQTNFTRQAPHLSPHLVHQSLTIQTERMETVRILAVELDMRSKKYYFLDMDLIPVLSSPGEEQSCMEGVWGRTSCQPSSQPIDAARYDLGGKEEGPFSQQFPANLFHF